jgi:KaiC/GvpD/RAD55 family RecA-like ATPase
MRLPKRDTIILQNSHIIDRAGKRMQLAKTLAEGLDEMLGGELPDKTVILMMGEPGSGYDVFGQQLLYQHALKGDKVARFATMRSSNALKEDLGIFDCDVMSLEKTDQWVFVDVHAPDALQILRKEIHSRIKKGCWTLVDSLSYLLQTQEVDLVLKMVELLLETARKYGWIPFLFLLRGIQDSQTEITLQRLVAGVIEFTAQEVAGENRQTNTNEENEENYLHS